MKNISCSRLIFVSLFVFNTSAFAAAYDEGIQAVRRQDYSSAIRILQPLAIKGNLDAERELGNIYAWNKGFINPKLALSWLGAAADAGNPAALRDLALVYENGKIVQKDHMEAQRLFKIAAEKGDVLASGLIDPQQTLVPVSQRGPATQALIDFDDNTPMFLQKISEIKDSNMRDASMKEFIKIRWTKEAAAVAEQEPAQLKSGAASSKEINDIKMREEQDQAYTSQNDLLDKQKELEDRQTELEINRTMMKCGSQLWKKKVTLGSFYYLRDVMPSRT